MEPSNLVVNPRMFMENQHELTEFEQSQEKALSFCHFVFYLHCLSVIINILEYLALVLCQLNQNDVKKSQISISLCKLGLFSEWNVQISEFEH